MTLSVQFRTDKVRAIISYRTQSSLLIAVVLTASVAATVWLLLYGGTGLLIAGFWHSSNWVQQHQSVALLLFFALSFLSQLIVMPSGSLMLLLAGFALGALPAAAAFGLAQVLSAWPMYSLSRHAIKPVEDGFARSADKHRIRSVLGRLASLRGNDVLATCLLRVTPVIPSAGACLLAAMSGIALRPFLIGTVLTCWIRPLFFASSGAAVSSVLAETDAEKVILGLDVTPLILVFVSVLVLFVLSRRFSN